MCWELEWEVWDQNFICSAEIHYLIQFWRIIYWWFLCWTIVPFIKERYVREGRKPECGTDLPFISRAISFNKTEFENVVCNLMAKFIRRCVNGISLLLSISHIACRIKTWLTCCYTHFSQCVIAIHENKNYVRMLKYTRYVFVSYPRKIH